MYHEFSLFYPESDRHISTDQLALLFLFSSPSPSSLQQFRQRQICCGACFADELPAGLRTRNHAADLGASDRGIVAHILKVRGNEGLRDINCISRRSWLLWTLLFSLSYCVV